MWFLLHLTAVIIMYCKKVRETLCMVSESSPNVGTVWSTSYKVKGLHGQGGLSAYVHSHSGSLVGRASGAQSCSWRSHLSCCYLTTSQISALWLLEVSVKPRVKKCNIQGKSRLYFDVGGRALNEGNNQSASPRSHLKAYQVTLNDSVTMANNLTKTIVLSSSSPGQITNQSPFT